MATTRPATALTAEERDRLIALADGPRDRAILTLFLYAGLRRNELRMLDRADIDSERGAVLVRFAKRGRVRTVPLHPLAVAAVADYVATRDDDHPALFLSARGDRLGLKTLWHLMEKYEARLGLDRPVRLHSLRHTCLTAAYEGSGHDIEAVRRIAGHSDLRITARYLHPDEGAVRRAIEAQ